MTERPGETQLPHLFEPVTWAGLAIKNRIKYGACCVSNYNTRDGFVSERELARTKVIAGTGCGIITNQGAYPDPLGEGKAYFSQLALFDDKFIPQFEKIAGYIHDGGGIAIQQILHAGRYGGIDLGYCIQPSVVPQTLPHFRPPREITKEQIRETIEQHAEAAKRALKAGFDGTEITSFMGYLLATFNSKFTNRRTDEYGGSIANRGRFMRELIYAIKAATGDSHPLVVRLSGAELMDRWGGNDEDECLALMQQAAECGVDMISVTVGWQEAPELVDRPGRAARPLEQARGAGEAAAARHADRLRRASARSDHGRAMPRGGAIRFLGGVPSALGRPGSGEEGGGGAPGRGQALRRLAQLPLAAVSRPALYLHGEPRAGPRGRAGVPDHAGRGAEEDHDHRRRSRGHGMRHRRDPARASRHRLRARRADRRQPARLCGARSRAQGRPRECGRVLSRHGGEARHRGAARHRGRSQDDAQRSPPIRRCRRRRGRAGGFAGASGSGGGGPLGGGASTLRWGSGGPGGASWCSAAARSGSRSRSRSRRPVPKSSSSSASGALPATSCRHGSGATPPGSRNWTSRP